MTSRPDEVTDAQREACAVMSMRSMLEDLANRSDTTVESRLEQFASSRTYTELFDFSTGLWAEGPDYLWHRWMTETEA